jgi:hypothetical protein
MDTPNSRFQSHVVGSLIETGLKLKEQMLRIFGSAPINKETGKLAPAPVTLNLS